MLLMPAKVFLLRFGWIAKLSQEASSLIEYENIEMFEAILEAPAQLLLQLYIISRGQSPGEYIGM